mmetsp:Transcript_38051/g.51475  ORF Transcript_38051/g.51475 Transcript_38051/m.51475 type:complete len:223 (-) Transcript_38051:76-744(-)
MDGKSNKSKPTFKTTKHIRHEDLHMIMQTGNFHDESRAKRVALQMIDHAVWCRRLERVAKTNVFNAMDFSPLPDEHCADEALEWRGVLTGICATITDGSTAEKCKLIFHSYASGGAHVIERPQMLRALTSHTTGFVSAADAEHPEGLSNEMNLSEPAMSYGEFESFLWNKKREGGLELQMNLEALVSFLTEKDEREKRQFSQSEFQRGVRGGKDSLVNALLM